MSVETTTQIPVIPDDVARAAVLPASYRTGTEFWEAYRWLRENMPVGEARLEGYDPLVLFQARRHHRRRAGRGPVPRLSDPTAPFGGIKSSGLGREMGPEGMDAYLWMKSIYLDPPAQTPAVG